MKLSNVVAAAVCALGAVSLVSCSSDGDKSGATSVAAETSSAAASSAVASSTQATGFDPCSLPDADIAAVGLNPASRRVGAAGVRFPGYDICTWLGEKPNWYQLNVYSTTDHTYDEATHNTTLYRDAQPVNVAGHNATQLHSATDSNDCTIAFDASGGPVSFQVSAKLSAEQPGDACAEAARISAALVKDVPSIK